MVGKLAGIAAAMAALLLLTSCSLGLGDVDSLLRAPALNQQQSEIYNALRSTVNLQDLVLKYPRQGNYRSAFVFQDVDGDGVDEAFIFFSTQSDPSVHVKVLKNTGSSWRVVYDIGGEGTDVDFVEFTSMSSGMNNLIIGWYNSGSNDSILSIYTIEARLLTHEYSQRYAQYLLGNFTGQESDELLLIEPGSTSVSAKLHLIRYYNGEIMSTSSIELAPDAKRFLSLSSGALYAGADGIFIDEVLDHSEIATEIAVIRNRRLYSLVGKDSGPSFSQTFRQELLISKDIDNDGIVEVPSQSALAGYEGTAETSPLYLTSYLRYQSTGEFSVSIRAAINRNAGYQIFFPDSWVGTVTVVNQAQYNEWRFYTLDSNYDPQNELLRVRVYSKKDAQDKFTENYNLMGEKNLFLYYYYIPPSLGEPLAISDSQFQQMFAYYEAVL